MKKLIFISLIGLILTSCSDDVTTSKANLASKIGNNNIYSVDPFNHIVFKGDSVYHYRTSRYAANIYYIYKIELIWDIYKD